MVDKYRNETSCKDSMIESRKVKRGDQLWIEFLKDPTRYEDFIIEVHLVMLLESGKIDFHG